MTVFRLCVGALLLALTAPFTSAAYATDDVYPELACVQDNGDGTYTAHFQVWNFEGGEVSYPIGSQNRFSPGPEDRGQETTFNFMVVHPNGATVTWNGSPLTWHLAGRSVTASASSQDCDCVGFISIAPMEVTATIGEDVTLVATVLDGAGNPIEGKEVKFYEFNGSVNNIYALRDTDANGQAFFTYTSEIEGTDIVDAKVRNGGCVRDDLLTYCEAHVHWVPCEPDTLTLSPTHTSSRVGEEHCVTATVLDADGDPVEGRDVAFATIGSSANDAEGIVATDANGEAEFCYVGENEGDDWIGAWVETCDGDTLDATVDHKWSCPDRTISLSPATSDGTIGDTHTVTATILKDGVPEAGVTVDFQTLPGSANNASGSDLTDASGEATFSYVGENIGTDTIIAEFYDGCEDHVFKSNTVERGWKCPPEGIVLAPPTSSGGIGDTHTVTATLTRTDNGDPLVGVTVFFETLPGSANTASGSDVTDGSGQASFSYVGNNIGTDTLEAVFEGCTGQIFKSNTVTRDWECPIESLTLAPPTSSGGIGTEHTVVATLLDASNAPIPGRTVNFSTLPGSANTAAGSAVTNGSGQAGFTYLGENLGTDMLEATTEDCAGDLVKSNTVIREWNCPPEEITLVPLSSEGPIGTKHTLTATLTRTDTGDPLVGKTVIFMTLPGSANDASGMAVSDVAGQAMFAYIGENPGLDTIQASFENCKMVSAVSNVVEREWNCPVETLALTPEMSEGPVETEHTVTALVLDGDGDPIVGRDVNFETLPGSANNAFGTETSDVNGIATFTYLGENEGTDFIAASIEDCAGDEVISNTIEREWSCPIENIAIEASPFMPTIGMEVKVVAIVSTEGGDLVEGREVVFEFLPGSINDFGGTYVTNDNGKAKFTYTSLDTGTDFIRATTTDCNGSEVSVETEVEWAECFLWIGKKQDNTPLSPPDEDIQLVKKIKVNAAVLETNIPMIRIPDRPRLVGRHVYAQVYLRNPVIFPDDPIQTSNGIDITLGVDELPVPYGPEFGIDLWSEMPALLGQDWTIKFDVRGM